MDGKLSYATANNNGIVPAFRRGHEPIGVYSQGAYFSHEEVCQAVILTKL